MSTVISPRLNRRRTLAELIHDLGDISPDRIRLEPAIGHATIEDVEKAKGCELVDGTLVEKAMGLLESFLAGRINELLRAFVRPRKLGMVSGEDGGMHILTGIVRKPDVAFISWDRFPKRRLTKEPVPNLVPDLAVEVISEGNTLREMARKRKEYFRAGVRMVWEVKRTDRTVVVYASPKKPRIFGEDDILDGGDVLPGLSLPVADIFEEMDLHG